ncbi:VOC family protein [Paenibacillus sp. R14(2021)]|uniref:VOC family protein n=1 Tax=Paenibacillus sp. R14(2021) TaxID=2859228 RepID=UPI001C611C19|nr:VOC family protein [Paenibacillus sp. R14(2021)]
MLTAQVKKVINCCIPVTNVKESAEWYVKHLGCRYEGEIREGDTFLRLSSGPDLNLLKVDETVQWKLNGFVIPIIHIHTDDANALHQYLKLNGVSVEDVVDHSWIGYSFAMYDPDGNKILIWQANDLLDS